MPEAYRKKCRKIGEGGDGVGSGNGCPGEVCHVLFVTPNMLHSLRQYETPKGSSRGGLTGDMRAIYQTPKDANGRVEYRQ